MKLQVNDRGSWRNVCSFSARQEEDVRKVVEAPPPARAVNGFRIMDGDIAVAHCMKPDYIWEDES